MAVRETGRRIVESPLIDNGQRFVMDRDSLAAVFDAQAPLLLLCNPHNPTGRVFERAELEAIASVAVERQLVVIADEVHADLVYSSHQHIPFASLGAEAAARTVTLTSATKAYNIPGLRCGVMHFGSSALREQFHEAVPDRMLGVVNRFGIEATLVSWRECGGWLNEVLGVLEKNRARMQAFLAQELPGVRWYPPEATFLAWLDYRFVLPADAVPQAYLLEHARVALSDGTHFGPGGEGRARLNFGTSPQILEAILSRLAQTLNP
jgi:cystathionine beta-lyase